MLSALWGILWGLSLHFYHIIGLTGDHLGFYELENPLTREDLESFWRTFPPSSVSPSDDSQKQTEKFTPRLEDLALFRTSWQVSLVNPTLGRSASVCLVEVAGDMDLILPDTLMLGSLPSSSDPQGCAVSRRTAETLYSSREALGETLYYQGRPYLIRGILDLDEELCLVQGHAQISYPNLLAHAPGLPLSAVRQQLGALLPGEPTLISEGNLHLGLGSIFLWLPAWPLLYFLLKLAAQGLLWLKSLLPDRPFKPFVLELFPYGLPILGFAGGFLILLGCLHFSDDYVPTAWSDFEFWADLFSGKISQLVALLRSSLFYRDLRTLSSLLGLFITSILEALLVPLLSSKVFPPSSGTFTPENGEA